MANVFDQFDAMPQAQASGNVFDQFDPAPTPESGMDYLEGVAQSAGQGATLGFGDEIAAGFGSLFGLGPMVGGKGYGEILEDVRGRGKKFSEAHPNVALGAEVAGGLTSMAGAPVKAIAAAPTVLGRLGRSVGAGAAFGTASGFGNSEDGIANRVVGAGKGGFVGAVVAPALSEVALPLAARAASGINQAFRYGNQAVRNARNPEQAAIDNVADRMVSQGIDPAAVRAEVSPPLSVNLKGRQFTEDDMADIVSRGLKGESAKAIGASYGLNEGTVRSYLNKYRDGNPTDRNILDIATDMSGAGTAKPLTRLARAAHSLSDDGEAAQRLLTRQETQAGRVNSILDNATEGRNFDDEAERLTSVVSDQARKAYGVAEANAQPFDLKPVIGKYRRMAFGRAGELREKTEQAIDAMFEPVMGADGKVAKIGQPITDLKRFQAARQDLDQMVARSMQDGKATPLTRNLTQLRQELTAVVRKANPDLAKADDLFSGAKGSEKLLEMGTKISGRLGAPSRQSLQGFEKLTPEQQELVRIGFVRSLQDKASNVRDGAAVANQFNSPAVRETIERLFPKKQKDVFDRGQKLIKFLKQEATTTQVKNEVLSGSRTAELGSDMDKLSQGAQAAADIATGKVLKVVQNLATRLTSQIGERGSKEVLNVLTETDPAKLLPLLTRLAKAANGTKERQAYVMAIRELRSGAFARVAPVAGTASGDQQAMGR